MPRQAMAYAFIQLTLFSLYKNTLDNNTEAKCSVENDRENESLSFRTIEKIGISEPRPKLSGPYKKSVIPRK